MKLSILSTLAVALVPVQASFVGISAPAVVVANQPFNYTLHFDQSPYYGTILAAVIGGSTGAPDGNSIGQGQGAYYQPAKDVANDAKDVDLEATLSFYRYVPPTWRLRVGLWTLAGLDFRGVFENWEANITIGQKESSERVQLTKIYTSEAYKNSPQ